jgi:HNH endonuclease
MTIKLRRPPVVARDTDGTEVCLVPLANTSLQATLYRSDYETLIAAGWSPQWVHNMGVVKVPNWRLGAQRVSRLIMQPPDGFRVRHRDRNKLNLRRENLLLVPFKRHPKVA